MMMTISCRDGRLRIGDEILKVNGMELGQAQVQPSINHALTFSNNGFIEIHVRSDDQRAIGRRLRSSCTALDDTVTLHNVDEQQGGSPKIFLSNSMGSTELDLYVPVYAANCKMIELQMSDDEKWQKLSKVRGSTAASEAVAGESQDIPKPMSMISLTQHPLDDVPRDRTKGIFINPPEGEWEEFILCLKLTNN